MALLVRPFREADLCAKIAHQDGMTAIGRHRWIGLSLTGNAGAAPGVMLGEPALSRHSLAGE